MTISPLSLSAALGMVLLGAKNETADGIAQTLCWAKEDIGQLHNEFQEYLSLVKQPCDKFELTVANRIYIEERFAISDNFVNETKQFYLAEPESANFVRCHEDERLKINKWVADQTNNKINNLIAVGGLSSNTKLVLVNAMYFKGRWENIFKTYNTRKRSFRVSAGVTKNVDMMAASEKYHVAESGQLKCAALEMPYESKHLSMVIILPDEDFGLKDLKTKLNVDELNSLCDKLKGAGKVELFLPKFKVTSTLSLNSPLSKLGMARAFSMQNANLSGMSTNSESELYISQIFQKVFVKVNERGTEAAASTAVMARPKCRQATPRRSFHVDHPFMFIIRDMRASGTILFMGCVEDPTVSSSTGL